MMRCIGDAYLVCNVFCDSIDVAFVHSLFFSYPQRIRSRIDSTKRNDGIAMQTHWRRRSRAKPITMSSSWHTNRRTRHSSWKTTIWAPRFNSVSCCLMLVYLSLRCFTLFSIYIFVGFVSAELNQLVKDERFDDALQLADRAARLFAGAFVDQQFVAYSIVEVGKLLVNEQTNLLRRIVECIWTLFCLLYNRDIVQVEAIRWSSCKVWWSCWSKHTNCLTKNKITFVLFASWSCIRYSTLQSAASKSKATYFTRRCLSQLANSIALMPTKRGEFAISVSSFHRFFYTSIRVSSHE